MSSAWIALMFIMLGVVVVVVSALLAPSNTVIPSATTSVIPTVVEPSVSASIPDPYPDKVVYDLFESSSGSGQVALTGRVSTLGPVWRLLDKGGLNPYQSMTLDIPGKFITSTVPIQTVSNELDTMHYDSKTNTLHGEIGIQWDTTAFLGTVFLYWGFLDAAGDGVGYMFYYSSGVNQYVLYVINVTNSTVDPVPLAIASALGNPFPTYPTVNKLIFTCPPDGLATFEFQITGGSTLGPIVASAPLHPPNASTTTRFGIAIDDSGNSTSLPEITGIDVVRL